MDQHRFKITKTIQRHATAALYRFKPFGEEFGRALVTLARRHPAEDHRAEPHPVTRRRRRKVETGRADEPGLHAIGTPKPPDQLVVVPQHPFAEPHTAHGEQIGMVGEIVLQRHHQTRHVPRRRHLLGVRLPVVSVIARR